VQRLVPSSTQGLALSVDRIDGLVRLARSGVPYRELAARVACSLSTVFEHLGPAALAQRHTHAGYHVRIEEREELRAGIVPGDSLRAMARALNRSVSRLSREVERNDGPAAYRAYRADQRAVGGGRRPRAGKIASSAELRRVIEAKLESRWSPQQIAQHLRRHYPHDERMRASHETIYQSLFVQARGSLRRELTTYLRTRRMSRRQRGRAETRGRIIDMVHVRERPADAADRAVPGHWEGDLLLGARARSAIATLVERTSRFVLLVALPEGRSTEAVTAALGTTIVTLPQALERNADLGSGRGDGGARALHQPDGGAGVLLRPAQPLAARQQREHQRPPARLLPQGNGLQRPHASRSRHGGR
jgi:transposase, IS30 family